MTKEEFLQKREAIIAKQTDVKGEAFDALQRELVALTDEFNAENAVMQRESMITKPAKSENEQLREFIQNAQPGKQFVLRSSMSTAGDSGINANVQGLSLQPIIENAFNDKDVFEKAGCPVQIGVPGNKIQWPFAGDVEAVIADELGGTTEKVVSLSHKAATPVRITCRVRISNQAVNAADFDIRGYILKQVAQSLRNKVNFAALSTTKAADNFYGGFAHSNKQTATYTAFSKTVFSSLLGMLAAKNYPTDNAVFVVGAEDYWTLKTTPMDAGSGIMLLGNDDKILGIPVIANNAINRATQKGTISGHNIGLGLFNYLPVNQHGEVRLSIDNSSATASATDETIITINADWSITDLIPDAFVVASKVAANTEGALA